MTIAREYIGRTAIALGVLGVFASGVGVGRASKRAGVEVREVVKVKEVERVVEARAVELERTDATARTTVDRSFERRTDSRPGRTVVVERWRNADSAAVSRSEVAAKETVYVDRWREVEKQETRLTLTNDARWSLTLGVGSTITWERVYSAQAVARIVGPFSLGVFGVVANGKPAVGLTAGVRF